MSLPGGRRSAAAMLLIALPLFGCGIGSPAASKRVPAPAPPPVIQVTMVEHTFEFKTPVPAGRVVFQIVNAGQLSHNLVMIPLADDLPPILEQLRGSKRRPVEPYAGIYDRPPGGTGSFAADLMPGQRYAMISTVVDQDGEPNWKKGMATEFRTPG